MKFHYKKSLGQNFLKNQNVLKRVGSLIELQEEDTVLEIGPGGGSLTSYLLKAKRVIAIEKDSRLIEELREKFQNVEVIEDDFLKRDIKGFGPITVVGSIPYYITTPIIKKLLQDSEAQRVYLIIQREVAERIVAKPGSKAYGALTLFVNFYSIPQIVMHIPNSAFFPIPKVDSSLLYLKVQKRYEVEERAFLDTVRALFSRRRKTIINNLKGRYNRKGVESLLEEIKISPMERPENLSIEDVIRISCLFK